MVSEQHTPPAGYGPGKVLHQARLDLKLSTEDVALQLHLAPRQIVALENDDFENLPQPTYVRGYLRSYAHLLGLSPQPILDAYARMLPGSGPVSAAAIGVAHEDVSSKDGHMKLISFLVAALVIGFAVAWWQGRDTNVPVSSGESAESNPSNRTATSGNEARPEGTAVAPPVSSPTDSLRPAPITPPAGTAANALPPPPAETQAPLAKGHARIVLRAEQESWAEIRDAGEARLLYETIPAGRTVMVEGAAPLNVFLGNADAVKVEFNGRPFDVSRYKRGTIARFVLGRSGGRAKEAPATPATQTAAPKASGPATAPHATTTKPVPKQKKGAASEHTPKPAKTPIVPADKQAAPEAGSTPPVGGAPAAQAPLGPSP